MPLAVQSPAATFLHEIGHPETLPLQERQDAPSVPLSVNAHIHLPPNFSAFDTVQQAVDLAAEQEIDVLGVSNYYDFGVYGDFAARAVGRGVFPLFGTEIITLIPDLLRDGVKINDPGNPGKMYLCGKGIARFDPLPAPARELLDVIRRNDAERMAAMTARLAEVFQAAGLDTGLDAEAVKRQVVRRHGSPLDTVYLQERHVAQAFQEAVFERVPPAERSAVLERAFGTPSKVPADDAPGVQNEIRSHLMKAGKPAFVEETFVGFDHAYRLISALGGIPCYPTLADGARPICAYEESVERLIADLKERGVFCAEFIPVRNDAETLAGYVRALRAAGLVVTAGTEHNTRDLIPLAPAGLNGQPVPDDVQAIFREGACVVAAHQYLAFHGRPGFVDDRGRPNADYGTDEERIGAFRRLGAAVLRRFRETHPAS